MALQPLMATPQDMPGQGGLIAPGENITVLTFTVSRELYAMPIARVKEIIEQCTITRVPMAPAHFCGMINLRGKVVPVVHLAVRLGVPPLESTRRACTILVEVGSGDQAVEVGMAVDSVSQVVAIGVEAMQSTPGFGSEIRSDFIRCMARVGERFVAVLDDTTVLSLDELMVTEESV